MPASSLPKTPLAVGPSLRPSRRARILGTIVFVLVAVLFVIGIVRLFDLRFSTGDVYPLYSTLRSDPLGTKALFESLQEMSGLRVERNVRPLRYLGEEPSAVLKHRDDDPDPSGQSGPVAVLSLGEDVFNWPYLFTQSEVVRLETLMRHGGRVIMAFVPTPVEMTRARLRTQRREHELEAQRQAGELPKNSAEKKKVASPIAASPSPGHTPAPSPTSAKAKEDAAGDDVPSADQPVPTPPTSLSASDKLFTKEDLIHRWHVDFNRKAPAQAPAGKKAPSHQAPAPLDEIAEPVSGSPADFKPVTWHSNVDFDLNSRAAQAAHWQAVYLRSDRPVVVERPFGDEGGKLILISDPYFFSNEALSKEPHPALLAALVGSCRRVIFEETHLGVAEAPGLMTLARRYHLEGALAALAALAILFLWKNMVGLVPPMPDESRNAAADRGSFVAGRDSGEGFVNLLRRSISPRDLLKVCLAQWSSANAMAGARQPSVEVTAQLQRITAEEAAQPIHRRSIVSAYGRMCAALKRRGVSGQPGIL